jgi:hypothetical protein
VNWGKTSPSVEEQESLHKRGNTYEKNGFWFSLVDLWPEYWSDNWYENDDVYVDYAGDGYYLYNRSYPGIESQSLCFELGAVQGMTVSVSTVGGDMSDRNDKKETGDLIQAMVRNEMDKPRVARSAKIAELEMDPSRIREEPSISLHGIVDKIIPSPQPNQPEGARIAIKEDNLPEQDLRIENSLTDEHGDDVKLKKGAHVDITVTAEPRKQTVRDKADN